MITLSDKIASITQYQSLLSVNENVMVFKLRHHQLSLFGNNLKVIFFSKEEVLIEGKIMQVIFDES